MHKARHIVRGIVIYMSVVLFAGGVPLSAIVSADTAEDRKRTYTYDADGRHWNDEDWKWDRTANKYVPTGNTSSDIKTDVVTVESEDEAAQADSAAPASDATVTQDSNVTANENIANNVDITNNLNSDAGTGDAGVTRNLTAGDAGTGDANAGTTIINSVHSSVGDGDTSGIANFTMDIYGDITGDISIGPNINNATIDRNANISSSTNVNNSDTLVNNQTLKATSGDATVSSNTKAGSAKSGDANTVANVLNLINTIIAANKSFIGTINIHGNLNGDILVSPDFIPQLLGSNAEVYGNYNMNQTMNINDDQSIVNNVKLNATSGTATVSGNTSAGTAKTGDAQTNLTILNLTGHKVDAKKSLLVFVNVLGRWVGMIVDAPGATSAALGSGVIRDTVNVNNDTNINNAAKIVNNLDLSSASGDATVSKNTVAGDAITGDATASANIANISTSEFNLSDWFGVLFINVYGTWVGSFGINTAAGTFIPLGGDAIPSAGARVAALPATNQLMNFGFVESTQHSDASAAGGSGAGNRPTGPAQFGAKAQAIRLPVTNRAEVTRTLEDALSNALIIGGLGTAGIASALLLIRRRRPLVPISPQGGSLASMVNENL